MRGGRRRDWTKPWGTIDHWNHGTVRIPQKSNQFGWHLSTRSTSGVPASTIRLCLDRSKVYRCATSRCETFRVVRFDELLTTGKTDISAHVPRRIPTKQPASFWMLTLRERHGCPERPINGKEDITESFPHSNDRNSYLGESARAGWPVGLAIPPCKLRLNEHQLVSI